MSIIQCPNCRVDMLPQARAGIVIDICPGCKGVWLDPGEIDLVEMRQNPANRNAPARTTLCPRGFLPPGESELRFWRRLGDAE